MKIYYATTAGKLGGAAVTRYDDGQMSCSCVVFRELRKRGPNSCVCSHITQVQAMLEAKEPKAVKPPASVAIPYASRPRPDESKVVKPVKFGQRRIREE